MFHLVFLPFWISLLVIAFALSLFGCNKGESEKESGDCGPKANFEKNIKKEEKFNRPGFDKNLPNILPATHVASKEQDEEVEIEIDMNMSKASVISKASAINTAKGKSAKDSKKVPKS